MFNMFLFDSTESVVEVLWDIALAVFVVRVAFVYAAVVALSTAVLAWAAHAGLPYLVASVPHAAAGAPTTTATTVTFAGHGGPVGLALSSTASLLLVAVCNYLVIIAYYKAPRGHSFRLAIGATAAAYVVLGRLLVALLTPTHVQEAVRTHCGGSNGFVWRAASGFFALAAIALMPWLSMVLLERSDRDQGTAVETDTSSSAEAPVQEKKIQQ
ncbi:hypothetical protein SPI_00656 [Niveomyces insectorum RCEF 264]|uniref:Uncharacterized protein n=1 Tax=Niveomyces insectorum RCEF 264 TaxID=1081102 RepID=A0A168AA42_9HYPO|nr:hypothetical protein SPI_00656 [Niveomyces insectorum RCEF 264]